MKKIFLSVLLLLFSAAFVFPQGYAVDKGSIIIFGIGSFSSQGGDLFEDYEGNRLTTFTLASTAEYFIIPNVFIGGGLAYTRQSHGDTSYSTIGIGPTVGYAFGKAESKSYPFIAAGIRYYSMGYDDESTSGTDIVISAGMIFKVKEHLGIIIEAGYHVMNLKHEDWGESRSGNIFSISIGIAGLFF